MTRENPTRFMAMLTCCLIFMTAHLTASASEAEVVAIMRNAATEFLSSLDSQLRAQATFDLQDEERKKWSNLPAMFFEREGVSFAELSDEQRVLAHRLIQSPLSSQGYLKAAGIMRIDEILKAAFLQARPDADPFFGQDKYWIGIFGDPVNDQAWGWQLDGHHLALNFTVVDDQLSVTPAFLGSDPAEIRSQLDSGWYVLTKEDSRGRELYESLNAGQKSRALLEGDTPADVIAGPGRADQLRTIRGLPASAMSLSQQRALTRLLNEYLDNLEPELAAAQKRRIDAADFDELHFSWAGTETGKPYYYRIHGPTILIEFDNNYPPGGQSGPVNHIHSVWRDTERDYGEGLLRKHYETSPHHQQGVGSE